jgi:hypothetical protein
VVPLLVPFATVSPIAICRARLEAMRGWDFRAAQMAQPVVSTSAPPRRLDGGDVDLLHRHHRLEGTLCLTATSRKRLG